MSQVRLCLTIILVCLLGRIVIHVHVRDATHWSAIPDVACMSLLGMMMKVVSANAFTVLGTCLSACPSVVSSGLLTSR